MGQLRSTSRVFKPRARLLRMLGDELIRDPNIALFELVKNAYDADSSYAKVTMHDVADRKIGKIVIEDDGTGMGWKTVTGVWLEPGTDFRAAQRSKLNWRTPKYSRLPLGEKGVGRFATGKLGNVIRLTTRAKNQPEIVVNIDWEALLENEYLSDAKVPIIRREPRVFKGSRTGTRIEITDLREDWTRAMVRSASRAITSICSPFGGPEHFKPTLLIKPESDWLMGLLDPTEVISQALFRASGSIRGVKDTGNFVTYHYEFLPPSAMNRVEGRKNDVEDLKFTIRRGENRDSNTIPSLSDHEIGVVSFKLYIFDLDPQILNFGSADRRGLREFLRRNGGIRVYRDGMRVFNYGEQGDDWLDLGGRRVNVPTRRLSNNLVIGEFSIGLDNSSSLIEKTNREGFVENKAFWAFQQAVMDCVDRITLERNEDKIRIRNAYSRQRQGVLEAMQTLRETLDRHGLLHEVGGYVDTVERELQEIRDRLLTAAGAGLSLTIVIHEVGKGIQELGKAVERDVSIPRVRELAKHLAELVDGLTYITKRSGRQTENASSLVRQALFNTEYRQNFHDIEVQNGFDDGLEDFKVRCSRRLVIATLMNLIDNSIYWLNQKGGQNKRIYIGPSRAFGGEPAIIVADNGPGFNDSPEMLVEPFMTTKPDGMGLGLHVASEIMKVHDGRLLFPEPDDLDIPSGLSGALVALVFKEG